MAVIKPALINALSTAWRSDFQKAFLATKSDYQRVATVIPSTSASNTYGWLGQFPALREWIGPRVLKDMKAQAYAIQNKLYESSVSVKRTDIEDDSVGIYSALFASAGRQAAIYPDQHVFALMKKAHQTICYDGQNFYDTEHPVYENVDGTGAVKLVSNNFGTGTGEAWYLIDASQALMPFIFQERLKPEILAKDDAETSDHTFNTDEIVYGIRARSAVGCGLWQLSARSTETLNHANFAKVYDAMRMVSADGGNPMNVRATLLVVPPALRSQAVDIVEKQYLASSESNPNYKIVEVLDSSYLM